MRRGVAAIDLGHAANVEARDAGWIRFLEDDETWPELLALVRRFVAEGLKSGDVQARVVARLVGS